jgi:large subunit ribosomal protein L22
MQVRAISKSVRMSPRKVRLVADAIRKLSIDEAFAVLEATHNRAAQPIAKTLESAVANAVTNNSLVRENLLIETVMVNEGQAMKRFHPSSRGRVHPYKKKSSHILIVLSEKSAKKSVSAVKPAVAKEETIESKEAEVSAKKTASGKATAAKSVRQAQDKGGKK